MSRPVITSTNGRQLYTISPDGRLVPIARPEDADLFIPAGRPGPLVAHLAGAAVPATELGDGTYSVGPVPAHVLRRAG